jgi:hypothetical protein
VKWFLEAQAVLPELGRFVSNQCAGSPAFDCRLNLKEPQWHCRDASTWVSRERQCTSHRFEFPPAMKLCLVDGGHWLLESHFNEVNAAVEGFLLEHLR